MADRGPRLLVADDDDAVREVLVLLLETQGFEVQAVANGREACDAARSGCPDLLLLDVMMPVQDGLSALRELKADPATCRIPVLLVSALGTSADVRTAEEAGAAGYLTKPFRTHELLARVDALLCPSPHPVDRVRGSNGA
jgi:DNA-binding response OmpR family regulator